jgi:hypothetical protein
MFLLNVSFYLQVHTSLQTRRSPPNLHSYENLSSHMATYGAVGSHATKQTDLTRMVRRLFYKFIYTLFFLTHLVELCQYEKLETS